MDNAYAILQQLCSDLMVLGQLSVGAALLMIIPGVLTGFTAAARTEPTLWRDVPIGFLFAWLAGSALAVVLVAIGTGFYELVAKELPTRLLNGLSIGWAVLGVVVCLVVQYRVAACYFRWEIQQRLGWKIDDPPPRLWNRRFSFSLRNLLLVQLAVMFAFGLWVSSRRTHIRHRYQRFQNGAWETDLRERLGEHGWELQYLQRPLRLASNERPLYDFSDEVLDKLLLSDQLEQLEVNSDALTDDGIKKIVVHQNLKSLELRSDKITDAGVALLKQLPNLQRLNFTAPQLTDAVLDDLQAMESLRHVAIVDAPISREAVARFREARPGVDIYVFNRIPARQRLVPTTAP